MRDRASVKSMRSCHQHHSTLTTEETASSMTPKQLANMDNNKKKRWVDWHFLMYSGLIAYGPNNCFARVTTTKYEAN